MPQLNKGGKLVFGLSVIRENGLVRIPPQVMREYCMDEENKVILFTDSRSTGGFCVTRRGLLMPSALGHILTETPALTDGTLAPGEFVRYKGRSYCAALRGGKARFARTCDAVFAARPGDGAPVHPQQRRRLHHGREGPAAGKGGALRGRNPDILKKQVLISENML